MNADWVVIRQLPGNGLPHDLINGYLLQTLLLL
jgi:hypothetical protein